MYSRGKFHERDEDMKGKLNLAVILIIMLGLLLTSLAACGGNGGDNENNGEETTTYEDYENNENYQPTETVNNNGPECYEPDLPETQYDPEAYDPEPFDPNQEITVLNFQTYEEEQTARAQLWADISRRERHNPDRIAEMENRAIPFGEVTMRFEYVVIGEKPENGRSLFIALHGGGGVLPEVNDQQFAHMQSYYRWSVHEGVHVAVRGVRDTWNTHFNYESFPIYDRLIENMILFHDVDPNRIFLMGFSAGGDGVYGITPRMADRFAAVSMSAGHHNWVNPINFMHTPIILQCGARDTAFDRHRETVNFGEQLRDLGYNFVLNIHVNMPHNFADNSITSIPQRIWADPFAWRDGEDSEIEYVDANAVRFLEQHTREPIPSEIAWHMGTRAHMRTVESFYWLSAAYNSAGYGVVRASFDREANIVRIDTDEYVSGTIYVLLNRQMVDFNIPVILEINGSTNEIIVESCSNTLMETTKERLDPNFQFTARVRVEI